MLYFLNYYTLENISIWLNKNAWVNFSSLGLCEHLMCSGTFILSVYTWHPLKNVCLSTWKAERGKGGGGVNGAGRGKDVFHSLVHWKQPGARDSVFLEWWVPKLKSHIYCLPECSSKNRSCRKSSRVLNQHSGKGCRYLKWQLNLLNYAMTPIPIVYSFKHAFR